MIETRDTLAARLAAAARGAFGVVAALGAGALWGWALGVPFLRDLGADFAPMPPAGALAFLLLAGSFFAAQRGKDAAATRWRRTAFAAALTAGLIAALTLLEDFAGPPLGMTFRWLAGRGGEVPALLSPAVCITLLVLAAATPLSREVRIGKLSLNAAAGTLVAATGFFVLLGLSLRVLRFDVAAPLLGFSAPAAVATLLTGFALCAARPSGWLLETLTSPRTGAVVTRWLLPAAFLVPLVVGWTRLAAQRAGFFGEAFGTALFTLLMIAAFGALVLWVARTLDHIAAARAQAEEQAGESREWLRVTLAAIGDGVIAVDADGRVRFLNAAAQRLTGWRAAEAAGRPVDELLALIDERSGRPLASPLRLALRSRGAAPGRARDARGLHRARPARGAPHRGARARERRAARAERATERHHHEHARPHRREGPAGTHPRRQPRLAQGDGAAR